MEWWQNLQTWINLEMARPGFWWQWPSLFVAGLPAWWLARRYRRWLDGHMGDKLAGNLREIGLRLLERLLLPLTFILLVGLARAVLTALGEPVTVLRLAMTLATALALVRFVVYVLQRTFRPTPGLRAWESVISTLVWVGVALYLLGWLPAITQALDGPAIVIGQSRISLLSVLKLLISASVMVLLALVLGNVLERNVNRARYLSPRMKVGIVKFSRVIIIILALLLALESVGIDLTALTVFGGALGVGIGFGLQRIASNFISGFILVLDRSIKPGDVISLGGTFGWVEELRARYLVVRDRDGVERLVPNENLITSEVINWSYSDPRVRLKIPVSISYDDEPEQAMQLMEEAGSKVERVLAHPAPAARLVRFGDNGIELELRVWISDPQNGVTNVRSAVNLNIWKAFKDHEITIPYPQRVLHVVTDRAGGPGAERSSATGDGAHGPF